MSYYVSVSGHVNFVDPKDKEHFMDTAEFLDNMHEEGNDVIINAYDNKIDDYIEEKLENVKCTYEFNCTGEDGEKWILTKDIDEEYGKFIDGITVFPEAEEQNIDKFLQKIKCTKEEREKIKKAIMNYDFSS